MRILERRNLGAVAAVLAALLLSAPASAATFAFSATDIVIDAPAPLFTTGTISGTLELADDVLPGDSFGSGAILSLSLNFGGIVGTLADIAADVAPGPVQGFGTRSADGQSLSVFDLRFGFQPGVAGCSFVCAGTLVLNSPIGGQDVSNFIAIDDPDVLTLSVISSYTPAFTLVPEPATWAMLIAGFGLIGGALRQRRRAAA